MKNWIYFRKPPMLRKSCGSISNFSCALKCAISWMTAPAERNSKHLKKAWVVKWNIAASHAFFKCLLFLYEDAVIHEMAHFKAHEKLDIDPQDLRNMGGLRKYMPKTFGLMMIASLALAGFPLTSGYLSKDSIVVSAYEWASALGTWHLLIPLTLI